MKALNFHRHGYRVTAAIIDDDCQRTILFSWDGSYWKDTKRNDAFVYKKFVIETDQGNDGRWEVVVIDSDAKDSTSALVLSDLTRFNTKEAAIEFAKSSIDKLLLAAR